MDHFNVDTPQIRWRRKIKWSAEGKQWGRRGCDYLVQNREDGLAFCKKKQGKRNTHAEVTREEKKKSKKKNRKISFDISLITRKSLPLQHTL